MSLVMKLWSVWDFHFFICFENESRLSGKSERKKAFIINEQEVGKVRTGERGCSTAISQPHGLRFQEERL